MAAALAEAAVVWDWRVESLTDPYRVAAFGWTASRAVSPLILPEITWALRCPGVGHHHRRRRRLVDVSSEHPRGGRGTAAAVVWATYRFPPRDCGAAPARWRSDPQALQDAYAACRRRWHLTDHVGRPPRGPERRPPRPVTMPPPPKPPALVGLGGVPEMP